MSLMPLMTLVFLVFTALAANAQAPFKLTSSPHLAAIDPGQWKTVHPGIEFRKLTLERSESRGVIELKLFRFDSRWFMPRLVLSSHFQLPGANVRTLAEKSGAIAAINANYFDEKGRPVGFLKTSAREVNRTVSKSSLFTGIFGVKALTAFIQHRDEFQASQADEALQSGPLLLNRGAPLEITRGIGRISRRAVIGMDKEQRLIIGATDALFGGLSWVELQELFAAPHWQVDATDLLNLDGGGSAQLYFKAPGLEEHIAGTSEIPVAIGFFRKGHY